MDGSGLAGNWIGTSCGLGVRCTRVLLALMHAGDWLVQVLRSQARNTRDRGGEGEEEEEEAAERFLGVVGVRVMCIRAPA